MMKDISLSYQLFYQLSIRINRVFSFYFYEFLNSKWIPCMTLKLLDTHMNDVCLKAVFKNGRFRSIFLFHILIVSYEEKSLYQTVLISTKMIFFLFESSRVDERFPFI